MLMSISISSLPRLMTVDLADFLQKYAATRPWIVMIRVIPAIILVGLAVALSLPSSTRSAQSAEGYRTMFRRGVSEGDIAKAEFGYAKLQANGQLTTEDRFDHALLYAATDPDRTLRLVHEIIVNSDTVFVPACLWWGARLLPQTSHDSQTSSEFQQLLARVLEKEPGSVEGHTMMVQFHLQRGEVDQAIVHLREIASKDAWLQAQLGMLLKAKGQREEAQHELAAAERKLSSAFSQQRITVEGQQRLATVYVYQERFADAVKMLTEGVEREGSPQLRSALADVYVAWANQDLAKTPIPWADCMGRLQKAIEYAPENVGALERIAELAIYSNIPEAKEALNAILAKGEAPGAVHLVLGTQALVEGKLQQAQMHLEQAYAHTSKAPRLLNNLAWLLAHKEQPELERALTLIDEAVRLEPQNASIHDTRGQILILLKRWKEAVTELELALKGMPNNGQIHSALAKAYSELGASALAEEHRKLAEQAADAAGSPEKPQ
jgi:tetratricopeptide (TPR) repeat protein